VQLDYERFEPTDKTPEVILDPKGFISIKGRAMNITQTDCQDRVSAWLVTYLDNPAEITKVVISLEYLNSFGTTILVSILQVLSTLLIKNKVLNIHWYYESEDLDILERGEYIAEVLKIPIIFFEI